MRSILDEHGASVSFVNITILSLLVHCRTRPACPLLFLCLSPPLCLSVSLSPSFSLSVCLVPVFHLFTPSCTLFCYCSTGRTQSSLYSCNIALLGAMANYIHADIYYCTSSHCISFASYLHRLLISVVELQSCMYRVSDRGITIPRFHQDSQSRMRRYGISSFFLHCVSAQPQFTVLTYQSYHFSHMT